MRPSDNHKKDGGARRKSHAMKTLKSTVVLCALFYAHLLLASDGWVELGNVSAVREVPQGLELNAGRGRVRITALAPNILRLRYTPQGDFRDNDSFAVLPNAFPPMPAIRITQSSQVVTINT